MTIEAYVENGQIVLPSPFSLPDGTKVSVSVADKSVGSETVDKKSRRTINERLQGLIGKAKGLPEDLAQNHDHYLHGSAKLYGSAKKTD